MGAAQRQKGPWSIWKQGVEPIWKQNGVWSVDGRGMPQLMQRGYFLEVGGRQVDFYRDYFRPFVNSFAREIRSVLPDAIIFVEGVPNEEGIHWGKDDAECIVHAAHWYDHLTLLTKNFRTWFTYDSTRSRLVVGHSAVHRTFAGQIARIHQASEEHMLGAPTIIGEVGIPFDMRNKRSYRTGDFRRQVKALDTTMRALESNLASFTLWNYTADNTNARGDQWNDEDLSIFSRDQQVGLDGIHDGGRMHPSWLQQRLRGDSALLERRMKRPAPRRRVVSPVPRAADRDGSHERMVHGEKALRVDLSVLRSSRRPAAPLRLRQGVAPDAANRLGDRGGRPERGGDAPSPGLLLPSVRPHRYGADHLR